MMHFRTVFDTRVKMLEDVTKDPRSIDSDKLISFLKEIGDMFGMVDLWRRARIASDLVAKAECDIITVSTEQLSNIVRSGIDQIKDPKRKREAQDDAPATPEAKKPRVDSFRSEKREVEYNRDNFDDSSDEKIVEETSESEMASPPPKSLSTAHSFSTESPESRWSRQQKSSEPRFSKKSSDAKPPTSSTSHQPPNRSSSSSSSRIRK